MEDRRTAARTSASMTGRDTSIKVASFNIHHGRPDTASVTSAEALAEVVADLDVDVLALQEVDVDVPRSGRADLFDACVQAAPGRSGRFCPTLRLSGGRYGNALVVRGELLDADELRLPGTGEPRAALVARVSLDGHEGAPPLWVAATHLHHVRTTAVRQLSWLLDVLAHKEGPAVVLGDLNLPRWTVAATTWRSGFSPVPAGPTFPARRPRRQIDWVLTRGLHTGAAWVPDVSVSDHRPVLAEILPW